MNNFNKLLVSGLSWTLLTACGGGSSQFRQAPTSQADAGLIVQADASTIEAVKAQATEYRVISDQHHIIEVQGLNLASLQQQFPEASVEQNLYFENLIGKVDQVDEHAQILASLKADGDIDEQVQQPNNVPKPTVPPIVAGCDPQNPLVPGLNLEVLSDALKFQPLMELGQELVLSAGGSQPNTASEEPLEVRWDVKPPAGSAMSSELKVGKELKITPDMVGMYQMLLIVKQGSACAGNQVRFLVTYNPEISFAKAGEDKPMIPLENFTHLERMGYSEAQTKATGKGVVVAVLDTGLHYNHLAIKFNLAFNDSEKSGKAGADDDNNNFPDDILGWDFVNGDSKPFDDEGHGSHVAGLVSSHIHGMAPGSKIMPIKVLNAAGGGDTASVIGGIYYAVDNGAKVINASLQRLSQQIPALQKAIQYAEDNGVLLISAAGNDGLDLSRPGVDIYPGEIEVASLVNVAALGAENSLTSYSNYSRDHVDVAAPGGDQAEPIYSLATLNPKNMPYLPSGGTSMAAPIVAGVAALVLEANPMLTPIEVKEILMSSGEVFNAIDLKVGSGRLLDASVAVAQALRSGSLVQIQE